MLAAYVKGVVGRFKNDQRVHAWDVWNEPDNMNASSYNALEPRQPLTPAPWLGPKGAPSKLHAIERVQLEQSDGLNFHNYDGLAAVQKWIDCLRPQGRPILGSEYMKRHPLQAVFRRGGFNRQTGRMESEKALPPASGRHSVRAN